MGNPAGVGPYTVKVWGFSFLFVFNVYNVYHVYKITLDNPLFTYAVVVYAGGEYFVYPEATDITDAAARDK